VVGSTALAEACRRASLTAPAVADLDLAWGLGVDDGDALLRRHGVWQQTTDANRDRGTLALSVGGRRVEITTFRGAGGATARERIEADLRERDMTVGAIAWWLAEDELLDPLDGLRDWREGKVVPCGDPLERVREHPVRWLRYYRRAHQWGFDLDRSIRRMKPGLEILDLIPPEAVAAEFRQALLLCSSPGRWFMELHEAGLLEHVAPELALQFDGRPAGPIRHHPEVSQALHLVLSLEWITKHGAHLPEPDRLTVGVAVLCHDLGKGTTLESKLPSHPGHEAAGAPLIQDLLRRLPGLADSTTRRLAEAVSRLHLIVRRFDELRPGTLADLYERYFRHRDFRVDLFALAIGADTGGRLGREEDGDLDAKRVAADIHSLRERCDKVDAAALRAQFGDDTDGFRAALHQQRAKAAREG